MMKYDKHTLGKRFSKFLTKMFWHFNEVVPNYSSPNHHSVDKHMLNSNRHRRLVINTDHDPMPNAGRYRIRSLSKCNSTLMSIQEENEIELMNCK